MATRDVVRPPRYLFRGEQFHVDNTHYSTVVVRAFKEARKGWAQWQSLP